MPLTISAILLYFWGLVKTWGALFIAPIGNLEMLWIIIPIYLNWIFSEFFQEKRGTSLGNAISNATIVLWVAIDWSRTSTRFFANNAISSWHLAWNIVSSILVFAYGVWVVYEGVKGKNLTHYIGRVRVATYIILMGTPLIYNSTIPIGNAIIAIILFFPLYYFFIELLDRLLPDPISIKEEEGEAKPGRFGEGSGFGSSGFSDIGSQNTGNEFGAGSFKGQKMDDFKNFKI